MDDVPDAPPAGIVWRIVHVVEVPATGNPTIECQDDHEVSYTGRKSRYRFDGLDADPAPLQIVLVVCIQRVCALRRSGQIVVRRARETTEALGETELIAADKSVDPM